MDSSTGFAPWNFISHVGVIMFTVDYTERALDIKDVLIQQSYLVLDEVLGLTFDPAIDRTKRSGLFLTLRHILLRSWLNSLLLFVPLGIVSHVKGFQPIVTFALNALAIVPLTGLLTFATEILAQSLGDGIGALLNITFGNLVEFIIL